MRKRGFTILETLIAITIMGVLSVAAGTFGSRILSSRLALNDTASVQDRINRVLGMLVTEIRTMESSNTGAYALEAASTSSITFYTDFRNDGLVERVRYFLEGGELKRGLTIPTGNPPSYNFASETVSVVIPDIVSDSAGIFSYYGASADIGGAPLASPISISLVRLIKISLTVDPNPGKAPGVIRVSTGITPRNLKTN